MRISTINNIRGAFIVWIISYLLFLVTLVNNFSASHDSIHYLLGIVNGEDLFHQHHLLYHFLAHQWLVFWQMFLTGIPHHYVIESFTAIWGSSVLAMVYLLFRNRFFLSRLLAGTGAALVGFSYGVWFYSVNIEVYMPPLFFILWLLYILTGSEFNSKKMWLVAVLHSLAILFHQVNVLFTVVVLYSIFRNIGRPGIVSALVRYSVTGIIITGGVYFVAGWFVEGHDSVAEWMKWLQGYTVGHNYWQLPGPQTPLHVLTGFSHAFIGGHFVFQIPAIEYLLQQSFRAHGLEDEIFLSQGISATTAWVLSILVVLFAVLFAGLVIRFILAYSSMKDHAKVLMPLLLCLMVYSLFFCFWMPEILEFWILQMVLVWLLLIGTLPRIRFLFNLPSGAGLIVMTLLVFIINFFGSIFWLQDINKDWYYSEAGKIRGSVASEDLIVVENEWILKDYLRYFTGATVIDTEDPGYDEKTVLKQIEEVKRRKGHVYYYRRNDPDNKPGGEFIRSD